MDVRKLISFGKGSYVVSIPKDWIQKNNLKKGSLLSMEVDSNSLLISSDLAESQQKLRVHRISVDKLSLDEIKTEIITAYLNAYHVIEIVSAKLNHQDEKIKECILNLAGLEILEQTSNKITAKFLIDMKEISLDSMVRRMDNITRSLIADTISCFNGACNYSSIQQRDADINRLEFLLIRAVRTAASSASELKTSGKTIWQLYSYLSIGERLEKIADRQKRIARGLEQLKISKKFSERFFEVYNSIKDSYLSVMTAYYKADKKIALQIELSIRPHIRACQDLLREDIRKHYTTLKDSKVRDGLHEYMIMTEIIDNLKAMITSIKMIARVVLNRGEKDAQDSTAL